MYIGSVSKASGAPAVAGRCQIDRRADGAISDKQAATCLAAEKELTEVPHRLCQFHYLRDLAPLGCSADRQLKKQLKRKVRGLREVERQVAH